MLSVTVSFSMPETRDRQLFVIGAGLGRTGTKNVEEPMELLYQKPCYHMKELLGTHEDHVELWSKLFDTLEHNPKTKLSATALTTHQPQTIRFAQPIKSWGKLTPKQRWVTGCQEECLMGRINISTKKDRVPSLWRDRRAIQAIIVHYLSCSWHEIIYRKTVNWERILSCSLSSMPQAEKE